ncbi:response regulator receiver protein [Desulfovibrio sp. X2]|uniref:response regulator n=1 Tax=Desulfovibrio sp. X2 TaxID=941449 RepID=UPI000358A365|nr:response regulator [Desulfovibrio sp. X2]EPR44139.1 response regulator receiver protein [Desulfovibrio sp. X2]
MPRFLVVDDSSSARRFLQGILTPLGECDMAASGMEAVLSVARAMEDGWRYDAIFMDIMMPEVDGLTACRKIREMEAAAGLDFCDISRIVVISCLSDSGHVLDAQFESGADVYLTKPVEVGAVQEVLRNLGLSGEQLIGMDGEEF